MYIVNTSRYGTSFKSDGDLCFEEEQSFEPIDHEIHIGDLNLALSYVPIYHW